jgi:hypothetical protein
MNLHRKPTNLRIMAIRRVLELSMKLDKTLYIILRSIFYRCLQIGGSHRIIANCKISLSEHMQHAALYQRMGDDPLPFLESAYSLGARGTYLVETRYSDWVKPRREELDAAFRLCVHQMGRLYLERGSLPEKAVQANTIRFYWYYHQRSYY